MFKQVKDIRSLGFCFAQYERLKQISKRLHKIAENDCNYGPTARSEKAEAKLLKEAEERAQTLGLHAYHQGDPRGCALYLVECNQGAETNYTNGIAICA